MLLYKYYFRCKDKNHPFPHLVLFRKLQNDQWLSEIDARVVIGQGCALKIPQNYNVDKSICCPL